MIISPGESRPIARRVAALVACLLILATDANAWRQPASKTLDQDTAKQVEELSKTINLLKREGKFNEAVEPARKVLETCQGILGPDHWRTRTARTALDEMSRIARLSETGRREVHSISALQQGASKARADGRFSEAERLVREMIAIRERWLDPEHPLTAQLHGNLGLDVHMQGRYLEAEAFLRRALSLNEKALGRVNPATVQCLSNLAYNLNTQGKYGQAELLLREALESSTEMLGPQDSLTAAAQINLAVNLDGQGKLSESESLYRVALGTRIKLLGPDHLDVAATCNDLAGNLEHQDKYAESESLHRRALAIRLKVQGEDHPDTALDYNNLAVVLDQTGRYQEAGKMFRKALEIRRKALPTDHPDIGQCYTNIAFNFFLQQKASEAEPFFRKALSNSIKALGENHPSTARIYQSLGYDLLALGRNLEAETEVRRGLAIAQKSVGPEHPITANLQGALASALDRQGKHQEAITNWTIATDTLSRIRSRQAATGLERAIQDRGDCGVKLACALAAQGKSRDAWARLEAALARGLLDDLSAQQLRPLTSEERRAEADLSGQLQQIDEQIAGLTGPSKPDAEQERQLASLWNQQNERRGQWVELQNQLGLKYEAYAGTPSTLESIQGSLPTDASLVCWVAGEQDHWACLVRSKGDPLWVRLAEFAPAEVATRDPDRRLGDSLAKNRDDWRKHASLAAKQWLEPLIPHLGGVKHLIILPSRSLAGVPIEALASTLPGSSPAFIVSYAPSGSMLTRLVTARLPGGQNTPPRLLALGDPLFPKKEQEPATALADPAMVAQRAINEMLSGERAEALTPLPGTGREIRAISGLFAPEQARILLGSGATESALQALASSGDLKRYRFIHLATHGKANSDVAMSSALFLAAEPARDPAQPNGVQAGGAMDHDGRITADQIVRTWEMNADLVVLSACESGLGRYAGGEGYLGFAQALFVKGARSLVLSLWKVDDVATALLMERFYQNLLGKRAGAPHPTPRAEALAEAKSWLRNLSGEEARRASTALPSGRRVVEEDEGPNPEHVLKSSNRPYEHPYYWSAFILVGDPS